MGAKTVVAVLLIVLGIVGLAYGGLTYTTHKDVPDVGPIHATEEKHHTLPLPPILGVVSLVGGIAILALGRES